MTSSPIEHIRLSQTGREHLRKMKRRTGITQWNTLCRWGFCVSLAESSPPTMIKIPSDSNVEMTWRTFGGEHADVYLALLKERCRADGLPPSEEELRSQFRLHLHRGISYLAGQRSIKTIGHLFREVAFRHRGQQEDLGDGGSVQPSES